MTKRELILVELKDGITCRMAKKALRIFLRRGQVVKFKRSDGWFVVDKDQLRNPKNAITYSGEERREAV
jgi:hypothetical protein